MFNKRIFWMACAISAIIISLTIPALAQTPTPGASGMSLSVTPPKSEIALSPGEEATSKVTAINLSTEPALIHVSVWDFRVTDTSGTVRLDAPDTANRQGLGSYITLLTQDTFTVPSKSRQDVSYRINLPSDSPGGSLFGAIVFSSSPPLGTGRVTIVSEVASLVVVRVSGVGLSDLPASKSEVIINLPVKGDQGQKIVELKDPVSKLEVSTKGDVTTVSVPVSDQQNVQQGTLNISSKSGVIGTGTGSSAKADSITVQSNSWVVDVGAGGSKAQSAQVQLSFGLNTLSTGSSVNVVVSPTADANTQAAIRAVAGDAVVKDVAYTVQVQRQNLDDTRQVSNAVITLGVSRSWAQAYGSGSLRIVRNGDDGSVQVLETVFIGFDGDNALYQAKSPDGMDNFSLVAFDKPVAPTSLAAGTVSAPVAASSNAEFTIILSMDVKPSSQAQAFDDSGKQVEVLQDRGLTQQTTVLPPTQGEVTVKLARSVQDGKLSWGPIPGIVLAGSNTLPIHFDNTGDVDYESQPGLATIVNMGGKVDLNMQVPKFNAFPGTGRDVTIEWITPSNAFGRYTLAAEMSYGDPLQMAFTEPITVWVIPWKWLLSIILAVGGLLGLGWLVTRSLKDYIEKQVKKRSVDGGPQPPAGQGGNNA